MIEALDGAARRWRIVYTGPGISGLQNAVLNGLCVTALTRPTMLTGMRDSWRRRMDFRQLEPLRVGLFYKHPAPVRGGDASWSAIWWPALTASASGVSPLPN